MLYQVKDWNNAYSNGPNIPGGERWPAVWEAPSQAFRESMAASGRAELDLRYGAAERNRLDLFVPQGTPKGLVVFIHGGFWLRLDKGYFSHLAAGPLAHGFAVAMPAYSLCPAIRVSGIVQEVAKAIEFAAQRIGGPLHITGHSAGGHLAARMVSTTSPLPPELRARIGNCVSIAGLHDLRPLLNIDMNNTIHLDAAEATAESPALLEPLPGTKLTCWVGAAERAEFIRQNALLANIWLGLGATAQAVEEPDKHHFTVIDGLADPNHPLTLALVA